MVIETFKPGAKEEVYRRFEQQGRMLPVGLHYLDSWLSVEGDRCYQIMETDNFELFAEWMPRWDDLVAFEIVAIVDSPTKSTKEDGQE